MAPREMLACAASLCFLVFALETAGQPTSCGQQSSGHCPQGEASLTSELLAAVRALAGMQAEINRKLDKLENAIITPTTCSRVKHPVSGSYVIDPDGPLTGVQPFPVECDMTGDTPRKIVHHDRETPASPGKCESPGCAHVPVTYTAASVEQIAQLVASSTNCSQYLKYQCEHSVITDYAWWVSRNGTKMPYWAGGHGKGCACYTTRSCSTAGQYCNCDTNDASWRGDEGVITDMVALPVTELRFGDLGTVDVEHGMYTLGPLICY